MSEQEEEWEFTDDEEEGELLEVQRILCNNCNHIDLRIPSEAQAMTDEKFVCSLCTLPEGVTKSIRLFETCSLCTQVYDKRDPKCLCPSKPQHTITFSHKSKDGELKDPLVNRIKNEIEESRLQGLELRVVRNAKLEKQQREIRDSENLDKSVSLLKQLVKKEKEIVTKKR